MLCKKGILQNFANFTGKHLCQILFLNKVAGVTPFSKEHLRWLFLYFGIHNCLSGWVQNQSTSMFKLGVTRNYLIINNFSFSDLLDKTVLDMHWPKAAHEVIWKKLKYSYVVNRLGRITYHGVLGDFSHPIENIFNS